MANRNSNATFLMLAICVAVARATLAATPATSAATDRSLDARIESSLLAAMRFLISAQDADGAWRSKTYGPFKDGPSLTPHVLVAISALPDGGAEARESNHRGVEYLLALLDDRGQPKSPLIAPVYTSSGTICVMGTDRAPGQRAWIEILRANQLNEFLGWKQLDAMFGGWGYSVPPPRKPAPDEPIPPLCASNLSATLHALEALHAASIPTNDPVYRDALAFVRRCQNFSDDPAHRDDHFDDGGFFFTPGDAAKNKAGIAGKDRFGEIRFHSYGSMTADGLRALLRCGLPPDHPRVVAARDWLLRNFSPASNPGVFESDREVIRRSTYFYYCWSVSHALMQLDIADIETTAGKMNWPSALAEELLRRQRDDGAWVNEFTDTKEDDPLIATPHAAAALENCRRMMRPR